MEGEGGRERVCVRAETEKIVREGKGREVERKVTVVSGQEERSGTVCFTLSKVRETKENMKSFKKIRAERQRERESTVF